ncbi:putative O-methyltransferase YrrM [Paraburkholderia sp. GAS333]|uniref:O-methyltransferase n=1 Tax=Paraburkholderia sp. GAS333 TaxID=3156279 RepID=UPI003D1EB99A
MEQAVLAVLDAYHGPVDSANADGKTSRPQRKAQLQSSQLQQQPRVESNRRRYSTEQETGRLINILARSQRAPKILELGTSFGYSTIWLADAARAAGGRLTTIELHDYKSAYARDMSTQAGLAAYVDFQIGNAVVLIEDLRFQPDFVLIDVWKNLYEPCLEAVYPKLNSGAIIVAAKMNWPHDDDAKRYLTTVRGKPGLKSLSLAVGAGLEISRYR